MPNHIKNRLTIHARYEEAKLVFDKYNTLIPANLNLAHDGKIICRFKGSHTMKVGWYNTKTGEFKTREDSPVLGLPEGWEFEINQPVNHFPDFAKVMPPPDVDAYKDIPNQHAVRNSPDHWYTWNNKNWGTNWNSYDCSQESYNVFTFETAWNGVLDLVKKISAENPDLQFSYEYADEDTGHNCASYEIKNGEVLSENKPDGGTIEAYELAFRLSPDNQKDYKLVDGEYQYVEED